MSYGYIYKTTNLQNNKVYIGQHKGEFTPSYLGSGKVLQSAIRKHGKHNFRLEIVIYAGSKKEIDAIEKSLIAEYRKTLSPRNVYNLADGGQGGNGAGWHHTAEARIKISQVQLGRKASSETRQKMSQIHLGRKKGPYPEEAKLKNRLAHLGRRHSEETKKKISLSAIGRIFSEDTRRKISESEIKTKGIKYACNVN